MNFYYLGLVFAFIIPIYAENIIFNSPAPGTTISVGVSLAISWTITVDSGYLTLESATGRGASPKLITSGLDGKSFTWTPTESDLSGFEGTGTMLRLLDWKDSVREGTSGTLNVDAPQKAPVVVQSSQVQNPPPPIISTVLAPQPTPVILNTIVTTQFVPPPPPPPSTNDPSTLTRSTISSFPTDTPSPLSNSNIISTSINTTNTQPPNPLPTTSPPSTFSPTSTPPNSPTPSTPIKIAIALPSTFSILLLLLLTFYLYKRAQKLSPPSPFKALSSPQRFPLATTWRKPELDTSVEILELAAEKERQIAELEGGSGLGKGNGKEKGKGGKKREVAELGGVWIGVEMEDTSLRMGVDSDGRSPNTPTPKVYTIDTNTTTTTPRAPSDDPTMTSISE